MRQWPATWHAGQQELVLQPLLSSPSTATRSQPLCPPEDLVSLCFADTSQWSLPSPRLLRWKPGHVWNLWEMSLLTFNLCNSGRKVRRGLKWVVRKPIQTSCWRRQGGGWKGDADLTRRGPPGWNNRRTGAGAGRLYFYGSETWSWWKNKDPQLNKVWSEEIYASIKKQCSMEGILLHDDILRASSKFWLQSRWISPCTLD